MNATRLLPPALMNGNGNPVGGIAPLTTAKFITLCTATIAVIPVAR